MLGMMLQIDLATSRHLPTFASTWKPQYSPSLDFYLWVSTLKFSRIYLGWELAPFLNIGFLSNALKQIRSIIVQLNFWILRLFETRKCEHVNIWSSDDLKKPHVWFPWLPLAFISQCVDASGVHSSWPWVMLVKRWTWSVCGPLSPRRIVIIFFLGCVCLKLHHQIWKLSPAFGKPLKASETSFPKASENI